MKQLKDYLHLYLGCECHYRPFPMYSWTVESVEVSVGSLNAKISPVIDDYTEQYPEERWIQISNRLIKPILRPLSDIAEEEASKIEDMAGGHPVGEMINYMEFSAEIFIYLLAKHFDLFGLIKDGLAIDKTTLTTNK